MTTWWIGTSGFSYPQWKGTFYPDDIRDSAMLAFYAGKLSTVEINNTFYRMPKREVLAKWAEQVPPGFRFILKASQRVSHKAKLKPPEAVESMAYLWKVADVLGERLGPVLVQTPHYLRADVGVLREFLAAAVPAGRQVAMELQHGSWDSDEVDQVLADAGCARCIADRDDGSARVVSTASWGYARLRRDDYDKDRLESWRRTLAGHRWRDAYVFFKHEDTARGAEMALELVELTRVALATGST